MFGVGCRSSAIDPNLPFQYYGPAALQKMNEDEVDTKSERRKSIFRVERVSSVLSEYPVSGDEIPLCLEAPS